MKTTNEPKLHRILEGFSEIIFYSALAFSVWALGTTHEWSKGVMNVLGYLAGLLLLGKWGIRLTSGWRPARWDVDFGETSSCGIRVTRILATFTVLILAYCLISALNPRAMLVGESWKFVYFDCIKWLPHSYNAGVTWHYFWNMVGLACFFWALRDWLLTIPTEEVQELESSRHHHLKWRLPARLRRLFWFMSANGALLALEGLLQRIFTDKLLWFYEPTINKAPDAQFGPYAYRSNGAAILNLIWPVTLGFWWTLNRAFRHQRPQRRRREEAAAGTAPAPVIQSQVEPTPSKFKTHQILLSFLVLMLVAVFFSLSRGAALVATLCAAAICVTVVLRQKDLEKGSKATILAVGALVLGFAWWSAGPTLTERFSNASQELSGDRVTAWQTAWPMVKDTPWFGTGPATFNSVYQLAHGLQTDSWWAQLHNDWLETLITFGIIGSVLLLVPLIVALGRWFCIKGIPCPRMLAVCVAASLIGCLIHAFGDFPMQIYSILFLFLMICSAFSCMARRV